MGRPVASARRRGLARGPDVRGGRGRRGPATRGRGGHGRPRRGDQARHDGRRLAALRPAFRPDGTITAGNASQISDGACAVVVMSAEKAEELGVEPIVEIEAYGMSSDRYPSLHTVPAMALERALKRAGHGAADLGLVEINEAFAAVPIHSTRMLGVDEDIVNVNGGAVALGHPIGASGARIVLTLALEMRRRGVDLGGAAICGGGGQGDALVLRRCRRLLRLALRELTELRTSACSALTQWFGSSAAAVRARRLVRRGGLLLVRRLDGGAGAVRGGRKTWKACRRPRGRRPSPIRPALGEATDHRAERCLGAASAPRRRSSRRLVAQQAHVIVLPVGVRIARAAKHAWTICSVLSVDRQGDRLGLDPDVVLRLDAGFLDDAADRIRGRCSVARARSRRSRANRRPTGRGSWCPGGAPAR